MLENTTSLYENFIKIKLKATNKKLNTIITNYSFFHIFDIIDLKKNQKIYQNLKDSGIIIINQCKSKTQNEQFFIISFQNTILIIKQSLFELLTQFFVGNNEIKIYFFPNVKNILNQSIKSRIFLIEIDHILQEEISNFNDSIIISQTSGPPIQNIEESISSCISGYLILQSYSKTTTNKNSIQFYDENCFIFLRKLGYGSSSVIDLAYFIDSKELYAIKRINNEAKQNLNEREYNNYLRINHPFIPKMIGKIKDKNDLIIQFINGQTLTKINQLHLSNKDKINIIIKIIIVLKYLNEQGFVYRDLKPNNIMIDDNHKIYLIDFDRMITIDKSIEYDEYTNDFQNIYVAPEVNFGEISYSNDVYSIGQILFYVFNEQAPSSEKTNNFNIESFLNDPRILSIYKRCTDDKIECRPSISELLFEFYLIFSSQISKSLMIDFDEIKYLNGLKYYDKKCIFNDINKAIQLYSYASDQNYAQMQYYLGCIYNQNKYKKRDISKAIHYFTLAANQNHPQAQFNLGLIFNNGQSIKMDIEKSIKYFSLAAKQNYRQAQFNLGFIYYEGKYINRNINKAIFYFDLAANQNHLEAQFTLGVIYSENKYINRDIYKAIHYFTLAANQNHPQAQYNLGVIYYEGKYINKDIKKAFLYFSLIKNKNYPYAHFVLGSIYFEGKYIERNIEKSIYYFTLAANKDNSEAEFFLGLLFYEGNYAIQDINKAIHYFSKASDHNDSQAQYNLGFIYYEGKYIKRDINKAIHYFSLASNNNNLQAQYILGIIYHEGKYIARDINKAIYYFSLSSNQNHLQSQLNLGIIFSKGEFIKRDLNKAIHYLELAKKQNSPIAQHILGFIYYVGKYVQKDIEKAILNFSLSMEQNYPPAQFILGVIYYEGKYVPRNINKAIHLLLLAANQDHFLAQYYLGICYSVGYSVDKNPYKGIDFIIRSCMNGNVKANFAVGYFYHEGKYVDKNIDKALHHYKEASSFNNHYAKNNLGIIYKHGFGNDLKRNIGVSISYFDESIRKSNDKVSMYNLSNIFIYEDGTKERIDESIELLIKSSLQQFLPSIELLCITLIKKFDFNIEKILSFLSNKKEISSMLLEKINQIIYKLQLYDSDAFQRRYEFHKSQDFLYNFMKQIIPTASLNQQKTTTYTKNKQLQSLTKKFYDGFNID